LDGLVVPLRSCYRFGVARRKTPASGAPPGAAHPRSIFTAEDVSVIHSLAEQGWTQREIAERMTEILVEAGRRAKSEPKIRRQVISKILLGERYPED